MKGVPPIGRMLIPLMVGVFVFSELYNRHWVTTNGLFFFVFLTLLAGSILLVFFQKKPVVRSLLVFFMLFFVGMLVSTIQKQQFEKEVVEIASQEYDSFLIKVSSLGERRKKSVRYEGVITSLRSNAEWKETSSKVLFSVSESDTNLLPGVTILCNQPLLKRPKRPLNPNEFDYSTFLERKGIAWTTFLPDKSYYILPGDHDITIPSFHLYVVSKVEQLLRQYLPNPKTFGLVKSMLLGRRDDLGADLLNSYIVSGTVHVLSVSGLHVGVLFIMLSTLFGGLKRRKWGAYLYTTLVILVLLAYALITGASPSVVRATLMCIIWVAAELVNRKHNSLNTLAISAFIILVIDPFSMYSVGFQLSYAAVLGILLFYPIFKNTYKGDNLIIKWIWQVSLVGFSAQLFTFPISLYYFHQFPTYFWLVNPFIILLTSGLIYSTLGLLLISLFQFAYLTHLVAKGVELIAFLMNSMAELPQKLPNYVITSLYLDGREVFLMFVVLFVFYLTLVKKEYTYLKGLFASVTLFAAYSIGSTISESIEPKLVFHSVARHSVVTYTRGETAYIMCDDPFIADTLAFDYSIKNYLIARGATKVDYVRLGDSRNNLPQKVLFDQQTLGFDAFFSAETPPWIVIRGKQYPPNSGFKINGKAIYILSPELGFKTREQWKKILDDTGVKYSTPSEVGAIEF